MPRLCERPGCSREAAVSYVIDTGQAHVLLAIFDPDTERGFASGVLCLRHADAMSVPRGWSLDDRREAMPRLFASQAQADNTASTPRRNRHRRVSAGIAVPTLPFDRDDLAPRAAHSRQSIAAQVATTTTAPAVQAAQPSEAEIADDPDATSVLAWRPDFAPADEIDDLRKARSPLLSRAFRGLRSHD